MPPLLETMLLKESNTGGIDIEKDREEDPDFQVRALLYRVGDETRADPQSSKILVDVVTDLSRVPKG